MVSKATFVLGLGVGYVLGARAGRGRYDQIVAQVDRLWHDPTVQEKAAQARDLAKEKVPQVQDKVTEVAHRAADRVTSGSDDGGPTSQLPGMVGSDYAERGDR